MDYISGKIKESTELLSATSAEDQLFRSAALQTYTDAYNKLSNAKLRHTMVTDEGHEDFNNIRLNKYRQQGVVNAYDDIISHLTLD